MDILIRMMNKLKNAQLHGSVLDYKTILHSAPDLYLILDRDLIIVEVSNAYLKATMVDRTDILGKWVFDAFPDNPDDPNPTALRTIRESFENVLKNKSPDALSIQKYDIRRPITEGGSFEERYWSPINIPIFDKEGEVQFILHRVQDVTEFMRLKASKEEQAKLMEELQNRAGKMEIEIYHRAQELQTINQALQKANQKLAKLDQVKTEFFADISHELRTPLMLILGPLEKLIQEHETEVSLLSPLRLIQNNAKIMLKHVNDLLDVSKLDANKLKLNYCHVDVAVLTRRTLSLFTARMQERRLDFTTQIPETIIAQLDVEMYQRILMNLISNAIKFTPDNGKINLSLQHASNKLQVIVEDSGPGIPLKFRGKIFDRFFQVGETTTRTIGGTGLGLAITRDFVELHAGTIGLKDSALGGARFNVELPLSAPRDSEIKQYQAVNEDAESASQIIAELKPASKSISTTLPTPKAAAHMSTILVVEDNPEMNQYISEILSDRYHVENAFNGYEGLHKTLALNPDLIISDIMMPKMSGVEMVQNIRNYIQLLNIPIIILTAKADDKLCVEMLRNGAQDYLTKPFAAEELKARIANLILAKKAEDELERFTYLASHDLKSPLPAMKNLIAWIEEDLGERISVQSKLHLELLRKRTARMASLLDGLLSYAQAGNHANLEITTVNCNMLVRDIIANLPTPRSFVFDLSTELPTFKTAVRPLHQVFKELIENSLKHHDKGSGHIKIGFHDKGEQYEFYIADDGPGIESKYHHRVFQLFQTLQSRDRFESSGVGLSVTKKIVESLGGQMQLDSEKDKGATFYFTWPKQL